MLEQAATNPVEDSRPLSDTGVADQTVSDETLDLGGQDEGGEEAGDVDLTDEEVEEIEHDGKKFKIPTALKPALLMHADYTRKTQEHAAQVRDWESQRAQQTQVSDELLNLRATKIAIETQLGHYEKVDWQTWLTSDQAAAQAAYMQYQQLKDVRGETDVAITKAKEAEASQMETDRSNRLRESAAVLAKEIPGWSPEVASKVATFAQSHGFTAQELSQVDDPRMVKILHLAMGNATNATQRQQVERIAAGQKTTPAQPVRGGAGTQFGRADTNDFAAFERLADAKLKKA